MKLKDKWPNVYHLWHFLAFQIPSLFQDDMVVQRALVAKTEKDKVVWAEIQRQLDAMSLRVKRGTIQDATFIEADPGSSKKP